MPRRTLRPGFLLLGLAALGVLSACQASPATTPPAVTPAATVAATATPAPPTATVVLPASATPEPPTATTEPTLTETAPPAAATTPDPNLGVGDVVYEDGFDGTRWGWTFSDDAVTFGIADGQLNAVMARSDLGWRVSSGPDVAAGDLQLRLTTRTNLCFERDEFGVLFRNTNTPDFLFNGYLFKLNCAGQARVELLRDSQPSVLLDWVASPAIVAGAPAENELMIWAARDQFHFYVNETYVGSVTDGAFADGDFGMFVRDRTNGGLSVSFTALTLRQVTAP
jgi:hypothetical protein